jgi:hypothetical protein
MSKETANLSKSVILGVITGNLVKPFTPDAKKDKPL